jgi:hypothetical protein
MRFVRSRKNDGTAVILLAGLVFFVLGIVGYFFGRIIQAAVSRQREFLADASAVQYTRNPDGIASALEKIAAVGSAMHAPAAPEFSHFFFASGLDSVFATHPPLAERIRRIRGLQGAAGPARVAGGTGAASPASARTVPAGAAGFAMPSAPPSPEPPVAAAQLRTARAEIGALSREQLDFAAGMLASLPQPWAQAAREPFTARAVVCGLLLDADPAVRTRQLAMVAADPPLHDALRRLVMTRPAPRPADRLPLLEIASSSLALLSPAQLAGFRGIVAQLIAADSKVDRVEWTVRVLLRRAIDRRGAAGDGVVRQPTDADLALVVSVLAWSGASDATAARQAWSVARSVAPGLPGAPVAAGQCTLDALDAALAALDRASIAGKRTLVDACVACVGADGRTTVEEAELLRAVCDSVGVPVPPVRPVAA